MKRLLAVCEWLLTPVRLPFHGALWGGSYPRIAHVFIAILFIALITRLVLSAL
jgi:hypothetical protein